MKLFIAGAASNDTTLNRRGSPTTIRTLKRAILQGTVPGPSRSTVVPMPPGRIPSWCAGGYRLLCELRIHPAVDEYRLVLGLEQEGCYCFEVHLHTDVGCRDRCFFAGEDRSPCRIIGVHPVGDPRMEDPAAVAGIQGDALAVAIGREVRRDHDAVIEAVAHLAAGDLGGKQRWNVFLPDSEDPLNCFKVFSAHYFKLLGRRGKRKLLIINSFVFDLFAVVVL